MSGGVAPVRVLSVIKGLGPGGAERLLLSVARAADHDAVTYDAAFVLPQKIQLRAALEEGGANVHLVAGRRGFGDPGWPRRLLRLVRAGDYDVVHIHSPAVAAVVRPLLRCRRRRPAVVVTQHNVWSSHAPVTRFATRLTSWLDDRTLAVSAEVADSMPARLGRRSQVVVHGIPVADLRRRRAEREQARAELDVDGDDVLVGMVANLRATKDHPTMLAAAEAALEREPRLRFVVVGQGPLAERLGGALAGRPALADRFRYLGHHTDPPHVLAACDIFTLTSRHEGLPIALLEAMALGLPVVATAVGGVPSVAPDGEVGILVPAGRHDLLADGYVRLAQDPVERSRFAAAAGERAARYDIADTARRLEGIYAAVTGRR